MSFSSSRHWLILARLFLSSSGFITFRYCVVLDIGGDVCMAISGDDPLSNPLSAGLKPTMGAEAEAAAAMFFIINMDRCLTSSGLICELGGLTAVIIVLNSRYRF